MLKKGYARFKTSFDPAGVRKYITQVSLLLLSLLLATRAEKCREAGKEQQKLHEYLTAIRADIADEIEQNEINLKDCRRDEACLITFLTKSTLNHPDSQNLAIANFADLYHRGVFRTFEPSTFDLMVQSGDANLLKDLPLRKSLASVFAFRQNTVRKDLADFDAQTQQCAEKLGRFFDLSLLYSGDIDHAFFDREGFFKAPHNEAFLLLRTVNLRGFHLDNAIEDLKETRNQLDVFIKKL